jgi:hypothetical protein
MLPLLLAYVISASHTRRHRPSLTLTDDFEMETRKDGEELIASVEREQYLSPKYTSMPLSKAT